MAQNYFISILYLTVKYRNNFSCEMITAFFLFRDILLIKAYWPQVVLS